VTIYSVLSNTLTNSSDTLNGIATLSLINVTALVAYLIKNDIISCCNQYLISWICVGVTRIGYQQNNKGW